MMMAQNRYRIEVTNDNDFDKVDEPVAIKVKDIEKKMYSFDNTYVVVKDGERFVPYQLDDMDGDMYPDELFFVVDIKAHEKKTLDLVMYRMIDFLSDKKNWPYVGPKESFEKDYPNGLPQVKDRVYTALQFRDKKDRFPDLLKVEAKGSTDLFNDIYMHGVTVESELTGYRIYFDARQNIDLYGKKYRRIELPKTQFYTTAEQLKEGYGVDVLWAGKAIGCGSFKRLVDGKPENWTDVAVRGQRVVTQGPLRTVVEVYDLGVSSSFPNPPGVAKRTGVIYSPGKYDVHQYYTLVAGHRDMQVDIKFVGSYNTHFCTGVQKVGVTATDSVRRGHKPEGVIRDDGIIASWGCDYPDMGKKQLWAPEPIGMAVYVPTKYILGNNEDELNYIYSMYPRENEIHYNVTFCADKEVNGYHSASEWFSSLDAWKKNIENPVKIRVLR